jgi:NAD(P)-dependent dehydrogenase (short-subunit alcohol dehydrogenase family)
MSGRVAVVTGGAGTLGEAFCESLAELGATVCILDISEERAQRCAQRISEKFSVAASAFTADISIESQAERAIRQVLAKHGRLDALVNNAAYSPRSLPADGLALRSQSLAQWDTQLDVILTGTFLVTRTCAEALAAHGNGAVVNVASIYGLVGAVPSLYSGTMMVNPAYYAAGKGGVVQLTRYLATLLAPAVRVNCIAPGGVRAQQPEPFHERYKARTPLGRMADAEDMKGALAFLATDLSSYVTGQILAVDGGWTAW